MLTLDQLLTLTGRMDDEARFDAPRERFRRFLAEYVADVQTARQLIEEGQHAPNEQHQRAVQDLVVLAGRFLGFRTAFTHSASGPHGQWQATSGLHVLVDVRSDQATHRDSEPTLTAAAELAAGSPPARAAVLCVVTPLCMDRRGIDAAFSAARSHVPSCVLSLRSFLSLAESVSSGRMSHDDLIRLIESSVSLDFIVELLDRASPRDDSRPRTPAAASAESASVSAREPMYWMCGVAADHDTKPEEFLELVVARRQIFGISSDAPTSDAVREGDGLCFFVAGRGIVGHARVGPPADVGRGLRDSHRFRQVVQLEHLRLHLERPLPVDLETQLRVRTARLTPSRNTQILLAISRESFEGVVAGAISATA